MNDLPASDSESRPPVAEFVTTHWSVVLAAGQKDLPQAAGALDVFTSARNYDPVRAGVAEDLGNRLCPIEPVLAKIDPLLAAPIRLSDDEFRWLVDFVGEGLLDRRAEPAHFRKLVPQSLPSGRPPLQFQFETHRP